MGELVTKMGRETARNWTPFPKQAHVLQRREFELLIGGARGGSKTATGIAWLCEPEYTTHPNYSALVIRKNADDLSDWIERAKAFMKPLGVKFVGNPIVGKFPAGGRLKTGHLKDADAYEKYQGHEYQKVLIEELTQIPDEDRYLRLISSCRSVIPELRPQVLGTTNPGGSGHGWVKARWVDTSRNKVYRDPKSGRTRLFIPMTIEDNPAIMKNDPEYVRYLESLPEDLRRAWRYGDWDVFTGQYFGRFRRDVHVVEPFRVPLGWRVFIGIDWGWAKPSAAVWIAVSPENDYYVIREHYVTETTPHDLATQIMLKMDENVDGIFGDPAMWITNPLSMNMNSQSYSDKSIASAMITAGIPMAKANNSRINGWVNIKDALEWGENRKPRLYFFNTCENTIRTLPSLVYDDRKVEDLDTDGEDHLADALRYAMMHTYAPLKPEPKKSYYQRQLEKIQQPDQQVGEWA